MDVLDKIKNLMKKSGLNETKLSKLSGVPQTTINSMFRKNNTPTIPTLESICKAFDMTLAEFFSEGDKITELSPEQIKMFEQWASLSVEQKELLFKLIQQMK